MKRVIFCFTLLILSFSLTNATTLEEFEKACENLSSEQLNEFEIPSFVPYKNEIFNIYLLEENLNTSLILEDSQIKEIKCQENQKPTYNVYIKNLNTIKDFQNSSDFLELYNQKTKNKEIELKGATFTKKLKLTFTKIALKIASWFS